MDKTYEAKNGSIRVWEEGVEVAITSRTAQLSFMEIKKTDYKPGVDGNSGTLDIYTINKGNLRLSFEETYNAEFREAHVQINKYIVESITKNRTKPVMTPFGCMFRILVIVFFMFLLSYSLRDKNRDTASYYMDSPQDDSTDDQPLVIDNSSAKQTTLYCGTFIVGEDIPAGRYIISGEGHGNLTMYDGDHMFINEILTDDTSDSSTGVPNVTVRLSDGQEINISGMDEVVFNPAKTKLATVLHTGYWIVGFDILAGVYNASPGEGESGNFIIYSGNETVVNEILDDSDNDSTGVKKVKVGLEDGQQIYISGLANVIFKKVE